MLELPGLRPILIPVFFICANKKLVLHFSLARRLTFFLNKFLLIVASTFPDNDD